MLKNENDNLSIDLRIIKLKGLVSKSIGEISYKNPEALLIETRFGIHTFFVNFPLDIIVLDRKNRVRKIKENLPPNRFFFWNPKYSKILELPIGSIRKLNLKLENILEFNLE